MTTNLWTKQMRLEKVTMDEFISLEQQWKFEMPKDKHRTYSRLHNPIQAETYGELIERFLVHPYAKRINVRDGLEWKRFPVLEIKAKEKSEIARLASRDVLQANHFEMKFDLNLPNVTFPSQKFVDLEFTRTNGMIVGYKMQPHRITLGLFDGRISNPRFILWSCIL